MNNSVTMEEVPLHLDRFMRRKLVVWRGFHPMTNVVAQIALSFRFWSSRISLWLARLTNHTLIWHAFQAPPSLLSFLQFLLCPSSCPSFNTTMTLSQTLFEGTSAKVRPQMHILSSSVVCEMHRLLCTNMCNGEHGNCMPLLPFWPSEKSLQVKVAGCVSVKGVRN